MVDRHPESRRRVTLEDLLRLKRAERPSPEFWSGFDHELRQRQLAALVERKSSWREAIFLTRLRGFRLPLGATAVLALTLISIHRFSAPASAGARATGAAPAGPAVATAAGIAAAQPEVIALAQPAGASAPAPAPLTPVGREAPGASDVRSATVATGEVSGTIPWLGDIALDRVTAGEAAGLRKPAAVDLSAVPAIAGLGLAAPALGFEERAMPEMRRRPTADVLPTAAAAAAPRRARLLAVLDSAGATFSPEPSAPEHVRRSATRYLMQDGDDRSMSRLDAEAVGLSLVRF